MSKTTYTAIAFIAILTVSIFFIETSPRSTNNSSSPEVATATTTETSSSSQTTSTQKKSAPAAKTSAPSAAASLAPTKKNGASDPGDADPTAVTLKVGTNTYKSPVRPGTTVIDLMSDLRSQGLQYEASEFSGLGMRIDSINGVAAAGGYYWFLYVNGSSSPTGASQTKIAPGDVIEWRYKLSD